MAKDDEKEEADAPTKRGAKSAKRAGKEAKRAEKSAGKAGEGKSGEEPRREGRLSRLRFTKKKDMPGGLWLKCESCGDVIYRKELEERHRVCPSCSFHFTVPGGERVRMTIDEGTWHEEFAEIEAQDRLGFVDSQPYDKKLARTVERIGQPPRVTESGDSRWT